MQQLGCTSLTDTSAFPDVAQEQEPSFGRQSEPCQTGEPSQPGHPPPPPAADTPPQPGSPPHPPTATQAGVLACPGDHHLVMIIDDQAAPPASASRAEAPASAVQRAGVGPSVHGQAGMTQVR
jgi:hypothetical protein